MPRRPDPLRLRLAKFEGTAAGIRDAVVLADPEVVARHRDELPALWERLDQLTERSGDA